MNYQQWGFLSYTVIDPGPGQVRECQGDVHSLHLPNFAEVDPLFQKAIVFSEFLFVLGDELSKGPKANCIGLSKRIIVTGLVI